MNVQLAIRIFPLGICLLALEIRRLADNGQWQEAVQLFLMATGMSAADLAERLGVGRTAVHQWRVGGTSPPERSRPVIIEMMEQLLKQLANPSDGSA